MKTELNGSIFERYRVHMFMLQWTITLLTAMAWCGCSTGNTYVHEEMCWRFDLNTLCICGARGRHFCPHVGWWCNNTPVYINKGAWSQRCLNTAYDEDKPFTILIHFSYIRRNSRLCSELRETSAKHFAMHILQSNVILNHYKCYRRIIAARHHPTWRQRWRATPLYWITWIAIQDL